MSIDDSEKTVISSRAKPADDVDDATVVVRRSPVDDETVISSREPDIDETVISSREPDIDETVISSRAPDIDETVISSRATIDDETVIVGRTPDIDETVISSRDVVDDATVVSRRGNVAGGEAGSATRAKKASSSSTDGAMFRPPAPAPVRTPSPVDDTVIGSQNDDVDVTVVSQRNIPDADETVISSRKVDDTIVATGDSDATVLGSRQRDAQAPPEDETVIAGGAEMRSPRAPDARAGDAQEFVRLGEPVVEKVERVDFGTPPPRIQSATDPAFLYESAMKQRQRRARRLVLLLVGSAVALGVILAVAIVLLSRS